ncbi:MAG: nitroreductase [Promethearchaeota archaeon CR_4]|nr:MAG: nitroreductase [Candidatus Lokiarchaeota archaeon CR_4]
MERDEREIGRKFQQATKYKRGRLPLHESSTARTPIPFKIYADAKTVELPKPETSGGAPLWDVIAKRRSHREFGLKSLTLEELGQLLWAGQGITYKTAGFGFRAAPSAGALYPAETYFLATNITNLLPGLYHYNVRKHEAELLKEGSLELELAAAALDQEFVADAPLTIIWTVIVERSAWKYSQRAYRYIYLDTAHIAENVMLAAAALGLGACGVGAMYDDEVNNLLGVDGETETAIYLCVVGKR